MQKCLTPNFRYLSAWPGSRISAPTPEPRAAVVALDESFFRVRFDRLTPSEKKYLRAMAELGPGPHRSGADDACLEDVGVARQGHGSAGK